MKITILYDNEVYKKGFGLKSDWGFSCLIETKNDLILFDTGAKGDILLNNMNILDVNPGDIKKIVISHEHRDHKGGLKSLFPYLKDIELYHLNYDNPSEKIRSIYPKTPKKICEDVWTTGRLKGVIDEQSLILKSYNDFYVLTGCSHPGIEKILKAAGQIGNIVGIIGGFHNFNKLNLLEDLDFICPCHCTIKKDDIKKKFLDKISQCGVGKIINLEEKL